MSYEKVHQALNSAGNDNREETRRRFPRRMKDICVLGIGETNYPVHDWSQCGVLFEADGRTFKANDTHDVMMKFKLSDIVTEIPVQAKVIRSGKNRIALEFFDVPDHIDAAFSKVIEDTLMRELQDSQSA